ncbi:MAG: CidA/LrgA family protein, partial [Muribaculaceae bacterium]|nr:CidA/LrgA family protein [Muribaculaceae bacterium]
IVQCSVLFAFLALGELIVYLTGLPIPSSIIGMILLTFALKAGVVKECWVDRIADFLVRNLGFFFVPAGVGLLKCLGIIKAQWFPIVMATVLSTILIIATTGWVHQLTRRSGKYMSHYSHRSKNNGVSNE